jgi:hypothetical protein
VVLSARKGKVIVRAGRVIFCDIYRWPVQGGYGKRMNKEVAEIRLRPFEKSDFNLSASFRGCPHRKPTSDGAARSLVIHWTKAGSSATSIMLASQTRESSLPRCCPRESRSVMLSSAIFGRTCPAVCPACSSPLTIASWASAPAWSLVRSRFVQYTPR